MALQVVVGTIRNPDGSSTGEIDGLVLRQDGLLVILDRPESERRVAQGGLSARIPGELEPAEIEIAEGPGNRRRLRTRPDEHQANGLLELPFWDRDRACWVNPLRPGGPRLAGLSG